MEIKKAVRRALPLQLACVGPEGSGKTLSALLLAKGLAGPKGRVCVIDTERGRASLYADNKRVLEAMPEGFDVLELDQPYSPYRFIEAINAVEDSGKYAACVIDNTSDSWNGPGGCEDMAEQNKGMWAKPKLANKKMMTRIKLSGMHIICCLKAQAKTKIIETADPRTGKKAKEFIELGIQPVCEKNFFYPILMAFMFDPATHFGTVTRTIEGIPLFEPKLISREDGERLRLWNEGGVNVDESEQINKKAQAAASNGLDAYKRFFTGLKPAQQKLIADHEGNKARAQEADAERSTVDLEEFASLRDTLGDEAYFRVLGTNGIESPAMATPVEREKILDQLRGLVAA